MTAWLLVQFTTVYRGEGPGDYKKREGERWKGSRRERPREKGAGCQVCVCVCDSIQAPGCPLDLQHVGLL